MLPVTLNFSNQPAQERGGERKGWGKAQGLGLNPEMLLLTEGSTPCDSSLPRRDRHGKSLRFGGRGLRRAWVPALPLPAWGAPRTCLHFSFTSGRGRPSPHLPHCVVEEDSERRKDVATLFDPLKGTELMLTLFSQLRPSALLSWARETQERLVGGKFLVLEEGRNLGTGGRWSSPHTYPEG